MYDIKTEDEFRLQIIDNHQLVVFIFHVWSGPSLMAKKEVEKWQMKNNRQIYLIDASYLGGEGYLHQWLESQEKNDWSKEGIMTVNRFRSRSRVHGYGEIMWIEDKSVIGFECIYQSFNSDELERRTKELFEKEK